MKSWLTLAAGILLVVGLPDWGAAKTDPSSRQSEVKWHPGHYMLVWGGYAGKMPLGTAVQTPSFGGKEGKFTLDHLYDMGVGTLKLNYLFWIRVEGPNYSHSFTRNILPFINQKHGAINTERPKNLELRK
jgi:hypothetical protein